MYKIDVLDSIFKSVKTTLPLSDEELKLFLEQHDISDSIVRRLLATLYHDRRKFNIITNLVENQCEINT